MVDQFATLILNSCSLDHLNQGWSQLNTCVRWELHAQAFYVTGHHCKNRNSGHSICEPQSPPPPSTYFLVMITECVCYQDKVSLRFHIPGIHASPCKTIHILGGWDPGQQAGSSFTKPLLADDISEQLLLSITTI